MKQNKLVLTILMLCAVFRMIAQPPPPPPPGSPDSSGCNAQVSITSSSTTACSAITFTATPMNAGNHASYQWFVNGAAVGAGTTYSATSLNYNDEIYVTLTAPCGSTPVVTNSNSIFITASPNTTTVSVTANNTNLDMQSSRILTASATNAGPRPSYDWYLNGNMISNIHSSVLSYGGALGNGDQIYATLTSAACGPIQTVTSNVITFTKSGSSVKNIVALTMFNQIGPTIINTAAATVSVTVPVGSRTSIHPRTLYVSPGATYGPSYAVYRDFSGPVTYTVVAQDGSRRVWTVTVLDINGNKTSSPASEELTLSDALNVYPVPANNYILATTKGGTDAPVVTVLDMEGRVMYNQKLPVTDVVNHQVDVSQYPVGTYIMYMVVGDRKQSKQFTIAK